MARHLIISTSGNPDSNSRRMGRVALAHLQKQKVDCDWIDISEMNLPLCEGGPVMAETSDRWLPIFWALDQFKSSQARDIQEGDWTMTAVDESAVSSPTDARRAFTDAMDKWDVAAADAADAAARGLATGDRAIAWNERGEVEFVIRVSPGVPAGVAVVAGVSWLRDAPGGRNVNALTSQRLTDEAGGSTFYDTRVDVRRAREADVHPALRMPDDEVPAFSGVK